MSTDVNDFDQYLKKRLYRDLLFRTLVWFGVSMATGLLAIYLGGSSALSYFERVGNTLAPLVNSIGVGALLFCVVALFLKDLEHVSKSAATVAATRGMLGGFVRRFAGDISLWTLGAVITMLSAMILAVFNTSLSKSEVGAVSFLAFLLALMVVFTSFANVFVRRSGPTPWALQFKSAAWLAFAYMMAFAFLLGWLLTAAI